MGTIAKRELLTLPKEMRYCCQEKAWLNEGIMTAWVQECLVPVQV